MCEYKKLYDFNPSWDINRITVERSGHEGSLSFSVLFERNSQQIELKFERPNDIDNIGELMNVDHVVVSKELNSQRDFGTIRLEFLDEAWSEIWCDTVNEINKT